MRLQFRSATDERGQLRSLVQALEKERDELCAEVKRLQSGNQECIEAREARWLSQQKELESRLETMYEEIKARRAESAAVRDEVQRLNNALDASNGSCKSAEARAANATKCLEEASARCRSSEDKVQRLTSELQELQAYAKDASRRAERCDALEAEMAEMKERLQRELLRRSEEISLEQKLQSAQKAAEERAEKAILRSEFAEQRAIAAEKRIADLEMQMAATTTDLTNSAIALQVAEAAKNRCIEEATTEKAKVAEIMERLSQSEAEKSSLQRQAETSLELRNQLANAAQQQKELATKAKQDEKRCKDLMQQIARLETHISHSDEMEKTRQAEIECLKEKEIELQKYLKQSQKEIGDVSAAMCAAEQRVAPLEMEASRCREEANEATREARQRRLEAEATRMAHYEQDREVQRLRERVVVQGEELKRLQTLLAMGGNADDVAAAATAAASPYIGPRRFPMAGVEDLTPRGGRPQLPPAGKRLGTPRATRPSTPRELLALQAPQFSKSRRTPSTSTQVPDDDNQF